MNLTKLRNRKAISPVISTIILIVVALVIALLVGVFAFGLFQSQTKSVALQGGNFYVTTGTFSFSLHNPGTSSVNINSVTVTGPAISGTGAAATCTPALPLAGGLTASCSSVGWTGGASGNTFDYVVTLSNGQSISGSVVGQ